MRRALVIAAFAAVPVLIPQLAEAACPANPRAASLAIWPRGTIAAGRTVTARHPCGRYLMCTAGTLDQSGSRNCQWL
ncbi:MAG TPA: hypothetical protein PK264_09915 [Hyphomicrobiaceae bacterium]|nr:hypothetical protein [Hyphomicrobiaceae bacterium]